MQPPVNAQEWAKSLRKQRPSEKEQLPEVEAAVSRLKREVRDETLRMRAELDKEVLRHHAEIDRRMRLLMKGRRAVINALNELHANNPKDAEILRSENERHLREIRRLQAEIKDRDALIDPISECPPAKLWSRWAASSRSDLLAISNWLERYTGDRVDPKELVGQMKRLSEVVDKFLEFVDNVEVFSEDVSHRKAGR